MMKKNNVFLQGMRDGLPIGLGYFAVAFSLGIAAKKAGLNAVQGFVASALNVASAGEYVLFSEIAEKVNYFSLALATLVVNARYFLMSCSLSQRFAPDTKFIHRLFVGYGVTDEIFGITIARDGFIDPRYNYGAIAIAVPLWSIGTSLGIVAGTYLPQRIVSALSVALYGMFLAIIIPPSKKNFVIACGVIASFALSFAFTKIPFVKDLAEGTRTIILTVIISSVLAVVKPVTENLEKSEEGDGTNSAAVKADSSNKKN